MTAAELLHGYEHVLASSEKMLAAAEQSQWDELVALEGARRALIEAVTCEPGPLLSESELTQKRTLITHTLELDERVRQLTRSWMDELQLTLTSLQAQRKLNQAYGAS